MLELMIFMAGMGTGFIASGVMVALNYRKMQLRGYIVTLPAQPKGSFHSIKREDDTSVTVNGAKVQAKANPGVTIEPPSSFTHDES